MKMDDAALLTTIMQSVAKISCLQYQCITGPAIVGLWDSASLLY